MLSYIIICYYIIHVQQLGQPGDSTKEGPGFDSRVRPFLCGVCMFPLGSPASSHSPKTCTLGEHVTLNCP